MATVLSAAPVYISLVVRAGDGLTSASALIAASFCAAAAATGSSIRTQERYLESLRLRTLDALATRDLAVERGIAEERLRIARDLHDAVGHEIAVINMNLGAAELQIQRDPGIARGSIIAARGGVQLVLKETQQILDILRSDSKPDTGPVADIRHLPALLHTLRSASTEIDADLPTFYPELDPAVSAAGYRIIQEALTNAQRHGFGAILLSVRVIDHLLGIEVSNSRPAKPQSATESSGYGLVGMRERALSVGGSLQIRATTLKFHVIAELNIHGKDKAA